MVTLLETPIDSGEAWTRVQHALQGNILRSHGRDFTKLLLLKFKPSPTLRTRAGQWFSKHLTSAANQTAQSRAFKAAKNRLVEPAVQGAAVLDSAALQTFFGGFLSIWGYLTLGYDRAQLTAAFPDIQNDSSADREACFSNWFLNGMNYYGRQLLDPPVPCWEPQYQTRIHAMVLLASDDLRCLEEQQKETVSEIAEFANIIHVEDGHVWRRQGQAIEPFGYADNISQPVFDSRESPDWTRPSSVLCPDRLACDAQAVGSFLVYRKLEQNVKGFHLEVEKLALHLGCDFEHAAAMVIGRFRDGSPLAKAANPGWLPKLDNRFDYWSDSTGSACPFHAHIRKVRPRDINESVRIVRRGLPYGAYDPSDPQSQMPESGSGLLFLAFQADIQRSFGRIQGDWANMVDFPKTPNGRRVGCDPLIGQGRSDRSQSWPVNWSERREFRFGQFVHMKGGEFFFAPSLTFFQNLATGP